MATPITSALHPENIAIAARVEKFNIALQAQEVADVSAKANFETQTIEFFVAIPGTESAEKVPAGEVVQMVLARHNLNIIDLLITMIS